MSSGRRISDRRQNRTSRRRLRVWAFSERVSAERSVPMTRQALGLARRPRAVPPACGGAARICRSVTCSHRQSTAAPRAAAPANGPSRPLHPVDLPRDVARMRRTQPVSWGLTGRRVSATVAARRPRARRTGPGFPASALRSPWRAATPAQRHTSWNRCGASRAGPSLCSAAAHLHAGASDDDPGRSGSRWAAAPPCGRLTGCAAGTSSSAPTPPAARERRCGPERTFPMADVDQESNEQPAGPLLRDPPAPPGYVDPLGESDTLEDPFATDVDAPTQEARPGSNP